MSTLRNQQYRNNSEFILQNVSGNNDPSLQSRQKLEEYDAILRAGPRKSIAFNPRTVNVCIVNTGGLCPGLNSVIEELVRTLCLSYQVNTVYGMRYGFRGFDPAEVEPMILTPANTVNIHQKGGTILGTCRGHFDDNKIRTFLQERQVKMVFVIGGDGSHRAAMKIHTICKEAKMECVVVGIPKTIDNDILYFDKTFGFDTAVQVASQVIDCAFTEASSVKNGVGLVKLMGRDSGFVARNAALSNNVVDACLIPEIPFEVHGDGGFLEWLLAHLERCQHAVVVISEAAAQEHVPVTGKDSTGHNVYEDTGKWLKKTIEAHWKATETEGKVFLIDPSYLIRSVPANSGDNMLCIQLAQAAVHTAFSGYSGVTVGKFHDLFGIMPINMVVAGSRKVNPKGSLWQTVKSRLAFYPGERHLSKKGTRYGSWGTKEQEDEEHEEEEEVITSSS
jgi:6-phosphofructokinase 1